MRHLARIPGQSRVRYSDGSRSPSRYYRGGGSVSPSQSGRRLCRMRTAECGTPRDAVNKHVAEVVNKSPNARDTVSTRCSRMRHRSFVCNGEQDTPTPFSSRFEQRPHTTPANASRTRGQAGFIPPQRAWGVSLLSAQQPSSTRAPPSSQSTRAPSSRSPPSSSQSARAPTSRSAHVPSPPQQRSQPHKRPQPAHRTRQSIYETEKRLAVHPPRSAPHPPSNPPARLSVNGPPTPRSAPHPVLETNDLTKQMAGTHVAELAATPPVVWREPTIRPEASYSPSFEAHSPRHARAARKNKQAEEELRLSFGTEPGKQPAIPKWDIFDSDIDPKTAAKEAIKAAIEETSRVASLKLDPSKHCGACVSAEAVYFCLKCDFNYCTECSLQWHRHGSWKQHELCMLEEKAQILMEKSWSEKRQTVSTSIDHTMLQNIVGAGMSALLLQIGQLLGESPIQTGILAWRLNTAEAFCKVQADWANSQKKFVDINHLLRMRDLKSRKIENAVQN